MRRLVLIFATGLAACSAPQEPAGEEPRSDTADATASASPSAVPGMSSAPSPAATDASNAGPRSNPPAPPPPPLPPPPPDGPRAQDDTIAGCPGMSPDRRPRGSNCYGIMPEQCGADRAKRYVGNQLTSELRAYLHGISTQMARIYRRGDAITDDLNPERLNVVLDNADRIVSVDCF